MYSLFIVIPILIILTISTYTDFKSRKIYNKITYPGMIYFLIYHLFVHTSQLGPWLLGFLALGGISFAIAWITNALGGGDIKLFALIGLAYGLESGFHIYIYTYVCAVLFTIPIMVRNKFSTDKPRIKSIPMAPFITLGTIIIYVFN